MHDRNISLEDLNRLRLWIEAKPQVPEGAWYKTSVRSCCAQKAAIRKTFLLAGQAAAGQKL
jgi:hypothetical protein